jgi:hypothetical protein
LLFFPLGHGNGAAIALAVFLKLSSTGRKEETAERRIARAYHMWLSVKIY